MNRRKFIEIGTLGLAASLGIKEASAQKEEYLGEEDLVRITNAILGVDFNSKQRDIDLLNAVNLLRVQHGWPRLVPDPETSHLEPEEIDYDERDPQA